MFRRPFWVKLLSELGFNDRRIARLLNLTERQVYHAHYHWDNFDHRSRKPRDYSKPHPYTYWKYKHPDRYKASLERRNDKARRTRRAARSKLRAEMGSDVRDKGVGCLVSPGSNLYNRLKGLKQPNPRGLTSKTLWVAILTELEFANDKIKEVLHLTENQLFNARWRWANHGSIRLRAEELRRMKRKELTDVSTTGRTGRGDEARRPTSNEGMGNSL